MELSSKERRQFAARGQKLKAAILIAAEAELPESVIAHVREGFKNHELIKVRIQTDDRALCQRAAQELARRIPCVLINRVGRVALLYKPADSPPQPGDASLPPST